jgi:hypothetical protein
MKLNVCTFFPKLNDLYHFSCILILGGAGINPRRSNINILSHSLTQLVAVCLIENAAELVGCCKWYVYMVNLRKLYCSDIMHHRSREV